MTAQRITKRTVDTLQPNGNEFTVWDDGVTGFGVRVRPTGAKSYVVLYRAGAGRGAPVRRYTIASVGKITPERARARAKVILGAVAHGHDPADQKTTERGTPTVSELADRFVAEHVQTKRKAGTAAFYWDILNRIMKPAVGTTKADKLTWLQVGRLHSSLAETPFQANRVLAVIGSMYAFAGREGIASLLPVERDQFTVFSVHRSSDATTDRIGGTPQRVGIEVRITLRGRRLRMAEQLPNDREAEAATGAKARIGVPEVVKAHASQTCPSDYRAPWAL